MRRIRGKLTFANAVALLALFVVLGGGAYAATQLPKNSVGSKQLKKAAVTPAKLSQAAKSTLTGPQGARGPAGARGATGPKGVQGNQGPAGNLSTNLPRDVTLRGRFDVDAVATAPLQEHGDSISFGDVLAETPQFQIPTSSTVECPGTVQDPRAAAGWLCLYPSTETNLELIGVGAYAFGADIVLTANKAGRYTLAGSWAVTGS